VRMRVEERWASLMCREARPGLQGEWGKKDGHEIQRTSIKSQDNGKQEIT